MDIKSRSFHHTEKEIHCCFNIKNTKQIIKESRLMMILRTKQFYDIRLKS